jgi:hypothetical protein
MHHLNGIVNQLNGAIEISAPMATVAIQGIVAELSSCRFWIAYITAALSYAKRHHEAASRGYWNFARRRSVRAEELADVSKRRDRECRKPDSHSIKSDGRALKRRS